MHCRAGGDFKLHDWKKGYVLLKATNLLNTEGIRMQNKRQYHGMVESLLHANLVLRPDISFVVNALSSSSRAPTLRKYKLMWKAIKYLQETKWNGNCLDRISN